MSKPSLHSQPGEKFFNIVLVEPEIPNNTGNIGRTCVGANSRLHIVGKMGFEITDKQLKRAGLDYWPHLEWYHHATFEEWWSKVEDPSRVFFFTTKSQRIYYDQEFQTGDWFVFGKETKGLDEQILQQHDAQTLGIPQFGKIRSLNVANAVSIVLFEGIRQIHSRLIDRDKS